MKICKQTLIEYLQGWANDDTKYLRNNSTGICHQIIEDYNITTHTGMAIEAFAYLTGESIDSWVAGWSEFSGNVIFPVPSNNEKLSPRDCYFNNPLWIGEYGASRKRLCLWFVKQLEKL